MADKYEVVEMGKNTWNQDGSPSITTRWAFDSAEDAMMHRYVRNVEAEIQGRTDVQYDALEDGETIDLASWEAPEDDVGFQSLAQMGYVEDEILSVLHS